MKKIWYHGTQPKNAERIRMDGFVLPEHEGIWGSGVYFADTLEDAQKYGSTVVVIEWEDTGTLHLDYVKDIPSLFPFLEFELEEGDPLLKQHIRLLKKDAATIRYEDGCLNLVVYDPSLLELLTIHQSQKYLPQPN